MNAPAAAPTTLTTLTKRADFLRLNRGKKYITPYVIIRYAPSGKDAVRVGLTVTTKCGNAVVRNRIKRRLREAVRATFITGAQPGMDYVLIARAEMAERLCADGFALLRDSLDAALRSIHP